MNGTLTATIARLILVLAALLYSLSSVFAQDRTLPLPPAATVLTLSGLNFNLTSYMPRHFGGLFAHPPYVLRKVRYPASLAPDSIARGVAALDAALRETSGPVIVLAHSQGAQVASHWMRDHANDSGAPSGERLVFLLTGNPLRAVGGYVIGRREVGGTIGEPTPVASRWRVIDVAPLRRLGRLAGRYRQQPRGRSGAGGYDASPHPLRRGRPRRSLAHGLDPRHHDLRPDA